MKGSLFRLKRDWEDLAEMDPYWAILSEPGKKHGKWNVEEFFRTGEDEVCGLLRSAEELGYPSQREAALDFGCGLGRLTRALARHFRACSGVDISAAMISKANELNRSYLNCQFIENPHPDLRLLADDSFDLAYAGRVLQHLPSRQAVHSSIAELLRVTRPGGLVVFQLPCHVPFRHRFQPRRRLYTLLRSLGLGERTLYERLGLHPIRMLFIPQREVMEFLGRAGAGVLKVESDSLGGPRVASRTYYVAKPPRA